MSTKLTDYTIIEIRMTQSTETSRTKAATLLAEKVRTALAAGWRPQGDMIAAQCGLDTFLYQPMVKFSD